MMKKLNFVAINLTSLFSPHSKISPFEKELLKLSYIRAHAFIAAKLSIVVTIKLLMEMMKSMVLL
jgi:hypothetical protein